MEETLEKHEKKKAGYAIPKRRLRAIRESVRVHCIFFPGRHYVKNRYNDSEI